MVRRAKRGKQTTASKHKGDVEVTTYAQISELDVWSYHATNLLIHLWAGLLLFGIIRRTLLSARLLPPPLRPPNAVGAIICADAGIENSNIVAGASGGSIMHDKLSGGAAGQPYLRNPA